MDPACDRLSRAPEVAENNLTRGHILRAAYNLSNCDGGSPHDNAGATPFDSDRRNRARGTCPKTKPQPLTRKVRLRDQISIIIGPPAVLLFDLAAPCMIYYIWLNGARSQWKRDCATYFGSSRLCPFPLPIYNAHILGTSIAFFGLGELYILLARIYRLVRYHDEYAPLLSTRRWQLDATAWVYGSGFLVAYLEICAIVTLLPFRLPVQIDSDPPHTPIQPLVYYAAEDFMAVDGCQGREFRRRYQARYQMSAGFRRMILELTLFWIAGCTIYLGCVSAMIWNMRFEFAFGSTLGLLFFWVILWAVLTFSWVNLKDRA